MRIAVRTYGSTTIVQTYVAGFRFDATADPSPSAAVVPEATTVDPRLQSIADDVPSGTGESTDTLISVSGVFSIDAVTAPFAHLPAVTLTVASWGAA